MYVGSRERAHLWAIRSPLALGWDVGIFTSVERASVSWSPSQFVVSIVCGPVLPEVEEMIACEDSHDLAESLWRPSIELRKLDRRQLEGWRHVFAGPSGPNFELPASARHLSPRFVVAVRTTAGLWSQAYDHGWPIGEPSLDCRDSKVGWLTAGALDSVWLTGLPYREEDVMDAIPESATAHVTVEYHTQDDLVLNPLRGAFEMARWYV
jgi:hypothetical protein